MTTVAELLERRAGDPRTGLLFEDQRWTWAAALDAMANRAAWLAEHRRPGPFHIGILLENTPEFHFWFGACALAGATMVGINPTRRGAELALSLIHI